MFDLEILKNIIAIPSFVNESNNETALADFIYAYALQFENLNVEKQQVDGSRYNVIVKSKGTARVLIAAHMDTVEPKVGWDTDQYTLRAEGDRLYGLGAMDTKGGIATMLSLIPLMQNLDGVTMLFYCDEEYDFSGMRKFIENNEKPADFVIMLEPTDLKIWNANRGLIEVFVSIKGVTGHAARPKDAKNAIRGMFGVVEFIENKLIEYSNDVLGASTMNVAGINGGLNLGKSENGKVILGRNGNNVADYCEAVIEIRTASPKLRAETLKNICRDYCNINGFTLAQFEVRHDLGSMNTKKTDLAIFEQIVSSVNVQQNIYVEAANQGFGDGQMIQEKFNVPVCNIGPIGGNQHGVNEWVSLESLVKLTEILKRFIAKS